MTKKASPFRKGFCVYLLFEHNTQITFPVGWVSFPCVSCFDYSWAQI